MRLTPPAATSARLERVADAAAGVDPATLDVVSAAVYDQAEQDAWRVSVRDLLVELRDAATTP